MCLAEFGTVHSHEVLRLVRSWDTNGRVGTLLFQKFLFSLGVSVQPVALRVSIPLPRCQVRTVCALLQSTHQSFACVCVRMCSVAMRQQPGLLGSHVLWELLWFVWVPWTRFHLTFLNLQAPATPSSAIGGDPAAAFAWRVQQSVSAELNVTPTRHSKKDALAWRHQVMATPPHVRIGGSAPTGR